MTMLIIAILDVVRDLKDNAYGKTIRQAVAKATDKDVAIGTIYATLDSLEKEGYVSSYQGEATKERGGRRKRYFKLEEAGRKALIKAGYGGEYPLIMLDELGIYGLPR